MHTTEAGHKRGMFSSDLLPIYLNDHLAGSTAGSELAKRAASANEGTEYGPFLEDLAGQIEADKAQLEDVMKRLAVKTDALKVGAFWLGEKLGRLKLNGRLLEYSPLSRVIELEGLVAGSTARLSLWRTLAAAAPDEPRIADIDFVHLVQRVEEQIAGLKDHHTSAVEEMLVSSPRP